MPANRRPQYTSNPATFDYAADWASKKPARDAQMLERFGPAAVSRGYNTAPEYHDWRARDSRADYLKNFGRAAAIIGGPLAAMYAIPAMAGGGAAGIGGLPAGMGVGGSTIGGSVAAPIATGAGAATTIGGTSAPAAISGASRMGSIFNSAGMNLGVNAGLAVMGNRSQNKAAEQARRDALDANARTLAVERERLEMEARNSQLDREDAKALNAAINELKKRELDAQEEQRSFDRGIVEQRETRLAPYRQISTNAANRLASMWRL